MIGIKTLPMACGTDSPALNALKNVRSFVTVIPHVIRSLWLMALTPVLAPLIHQISVRSFVLSISGSQLLPAAFCGLDHTTKNTLQQCLQNYPVLDTMSYRPITDFWILARAKLKGGVSYYGAYPGEFCERARALLGCSITDPVLHVCGGMAKLYPYKRGFGPNDKTLDLDPQTNPDFLQDAREPWPLTTITQGTATPVSWKGCLLDPPYSQEDAGHYAVGAGVYPSPNLLIKRAFEVLPPGAALEFCTT
jgi:hypothetical protein